MVVARHRAPAGGQQTGGALQAWPALPRTVTGMVMWERLDAPARRVMLAALDAADELGHGYIGDEHILLGLFGEDAGPARRFLERHGLSLSAARTELLLPDSRRERSPTAPRPSRRPARGRDRCRPCRTPAHRRLRTRRPQQGSLPSQ